MRGQASVELLGASLALLLTGLVGLQLLAAGYGAVMADDAAEAAALALLNGRAPRDAARAAVPGWPARAIDVRRHEDRVTVALQTPSPLRMLRGRLTFESTARVPAAQAER